MISVADALAQILALARVMPQENVPLARAAGRVMARPATARRDQPPFAAAAMDGYAVAGPVAPGTRLRVIGEAQAGARFAGSIAAGEAVRIFTGAPLPHGADRVVIQEDVTREGDTVNIGEVPEAALHVRAAGSDFREGFAMPAPRLLRPVDIALLAAMNSGTVTVHRRPVVAIVATGDELVMPGAVPGPDQIVASNSFALKAMAEAAGAEARMLPIARDDADALAHVLGLALGTRPGTRPGTGPHAGLRPGTDAGYGGGGVSGGDDGADLIVTIGGASVGDHDIVGPVTQRLGMTRAFYKVAMRPGKPLMAGRLGDAVFLGLPGNPVSSIVCGHVFMLPLLRAMQGLDPHSDLRKARLARDLPPNGPRAHYMRARLAFGATGAATGTLPEIDPYTDQDSARLTLLTQADALMIRPVNDPHRSQGDLMDYLPL